MSEYLTSIGKSFHYDDKYVPSIQIIAHLTSSPACLTTGTLENLMAATSDAIGVAKFRATTV